MDIEKLLKATKEKTQIIYKEIIVRLRADFFSTTDVRDTHTKKITSSKC